MDEITMRRMDVTRLYNAIASVSEIQDVPVKFGYALGRTRRALEDEVAAIRDEQTRHQRRRREIAERFAATDDDGKVKATPDGNFELAAGRQRAFSDAMDDHSQELADFMRDSVTVKVHKAPAGSVPWAKLTAGQVDGLLDMVDGEPAAEAEKPAAGA